MHGRPPRSPLFPYTTLFRSVLRLFDSVEPNRHAYNLLCRYLAMLDGAEPSRAAGDRKSTRLNSSHMSISYAVLCLKKKTSVVCSARFLPPAMADADLMHYRW